MMSNFKYVSESRMLIAAVRPMHQLVKPDISVNAGSAVALSILTPAVVNTTHAVSMNRYGSYLIYYYHTRRKT